MSDFLTSDRVIRVTARTLDASAGSSTPKYVRIGVGLAPLSTHPSGPAGGVLGGTFPNPTFAVDMATQAELNTVYASVSGDISSILSDLATKVPETRTVNGYALTANIIIGPSDLAQDATHRFATDAEKATWNAKQSALGYTPENVANKNQASGYAGLDSSGLVPAALLPSYVDDVLEYASLAAFPAIGETGKQYVTLDTNKVYRWSGSIYVEISASPGSTDAVTEGVTNLYFTNARAQAAVASSLNGKLAIASNLSDLNSASTARTNLGVAIGSNVQAYSANLTTFAGIAPSADVQTLLGSANFAAARTNLGLGTGDSPSLTGLTLSGMTSGSIPFFGSAGVVSQNNAKLFWDATNFRLGIGTNAPTDALDIAGALRLSTAVAFDATKPGRIYKGIVTGLTITGVTGSSYDFGFYNPAGNGLLENPTGTNNVVIARAGDLYTPGNTYGTGSNYIAAALAVGIASGALTAKFTIVSPSAATVVQKIVLAASQSADALAVYASDGTTKLTSISAAGVIVGQGSFPSALDITTGSLFLQLGGAAKQMSFSPSTGIFIGPTMQVKWTTGADTYATAADTGLARSAAGVVKVTDGGAGNGILQVGSIKLSNPEASSVFLGGVAGGSYASTLNVAVGISAGIAISSGVANTFIGNGAGSGTTTGGLNTFIGRNAGSAVVTGGSNVIIGCNNTGGAGLDSAIVIGTGAGSGATGAYTTAVGFGSGGGGSMSGTGNVGVGVYTNRAVTTGAYNSCFGYDAGYANITGSNNTYVGQQAGNSTTGGTNTFIGSQTGNNTTTVSASVFLGYQAGYNETNSNRLHIANTFTESLIYGEFDNRVVRVNGILGLNVAPSGAQIHQAVPSASTVGHKIVLAASQSADAFQVYASDGTTKKFTVDKNGSVLMGWDASNQATIILGTSGNNGFIQAYAFGGLTIGSDGGVTFADSNGYPYYASAASNGVTIHQAGDLLFANMGISAATAGIRRLSDGLLKITDGSSGYGKLAIGGGTPSSASDTGVAGQVEWDASFVYVCTATNTWKRAALATW